MKVTLICDECGGNDFTTTEVVDQGMKASEYVRRRSTGSVTGSRFFEVVCEGCGAKYTYSVSDPKLLLEDDHKRLQEDLKK